MDTIGAVIAVVTAWALATMTYEGGWGALARLAAVCCTAACCGACWVTVGGSPLSAVVVAVAVSSVGIVVLVEVERG